ncbi:ABC transporter ATP-binding protein [Candidatus Woesearchaeota archaeon]|nr:ABC transporter ATP-binding protein [Candidatus Woesearchaeota archaeon]
MQYPLIVSNLRKRYKSNGKIIDALRGISFTVRKGEIFGLLGPNGAGKTTTINILTGLLSPDSGRIRFFGRAPCEETKNRINTATAYTMLNGDITVFQNLHIYAMIYNVPHARKRVEELLSRFRITALRDTRVYDLSTGQKTRVNLCKCFINDPDLVFLDEATVGLDPHIAYQVRQELRKTKATIVFTSHIMSEVEELCDRIAFISKGKILKVATPQGIKKLVRKNTFVIQFLSKPVNADRILKEFPITAHKDNKISIELKSGKDIQRVIHRLITSGFEIRDFHIKRPTLDEIFIKIAEDEERGQELLAQDDCEEEAA